MNLFITLPTVPPSANHMYVNNPRTRGRFISKEAKSWKEGASTIIKNEIQQQQWTVPPKTSLRVSVIIQHPYILRFDVAGKEKALLDALSDAIGVDDRYVMELVLKKQKGEEQVSVMVSPYFG